MTFLLDVNVLIALVDPAHGSHDAAHRWFEREGQRSWATCPLTENGVLRILGHPKYPNTPGPPAIVAGIIGTLKNVAGHVFWGDTISLLDPSYTDISQVLTSSQVTDSYLLGLAASHASMLATFDQRISPLTTIAGAKALDLISI